MNKKIPKGFMCLGKEKGLWLNKDIIKDKKEYNDCIKYITIYNEVIKIKK